VGWVVVASTRDDSTTSKARVKVVDRSVAPVAPKRRAPTGPATGLLVRAVDQGDAPLNGYVTQVALDGDARDAQIRPLACRRVHMSRGRGVGLMLAPSALNYRARIFDEHFGSCTS
jgi:hypothetical protein